MGTDQNEFSNNEVMQRLNALEHRLSILEKDRSGHHAVTEDGYEHEQIVLQNNISDGRLLETIIGETGLSWLGNIVLFFGIAFLVEYIQNSGYQLASAIFGFVSVAAIFTLSNFLKKTYAGMSSVFNLNAYLLLFYVTLKLHFFSTAPIINNLAIGLLLLILVTAFQLFISVKKKSVLLSGVSLVLLSIVAIVSDSTHFMLPITVVIAIVAVLLLYRFAWLRLLFLSIVLVYTIILLWFFNNPLMGSPLQAIPDHQYGFIYLFVVAAIYSMVAMVRKSEAFSKGGIIGSIVLNGLGFTILLTFVTISFFKDDYILLIGLVSVFCLLYSVVLQIRSAWKITAALYALYGFVAFSISVHGLYDFPKAYFLLALQSLLVVSMAIWFRSKFIVFINTLLFLTLLVFYLQTSAFIHGVNISFSLVALITARILNWKRDRLTIKTDMLRNVYLLIGTLMVLFTLYHIMSDQYITLSWTAVAVAFFALSIILKNVKYRYIALGTMIVAAFYFFLIDLAKIELVFRIVALMFLALISIGLSIYYSRKSGRKSEAD